ncbi:hypothetical protein PIB30_043397 [Stylosanthes scabra]|uniref:Uncharacterized protein n=1 Tax=Stylosanthes scabra TaxID=79078 RepID=A0ABU6RFK1_9FABA|nr:hypothetical protein [Stylosanthes scabra]
MINASSGGALMNKTPEEAWELIETVADANQHFNRRVTSKGDYEVAPSDSTVLAKSLVNIASMLKEIREGQQATPTLLKRQPDSSQQKPVKHCGICSCNSHHTDEFPQLQEDNTMASTHNFYDQPQAQLRQPYTYSQPQNSQNPRYQPPHNRQQYLPATKPPFSLDEAICTFQRENQEMREAQKRTESQLNHLAELLQKFANQPPVNPQTQAQPLAPSPLPSQPLPNPKGGINAVQVEIDNEGEDEAEDEEEENDWLYEILTELANSDESNDEEEDESIEEENEEESDEEEEEESELPEEEDINDRDKGKIFFINTLFKEKKSEEEIPIKCEDPGPCLVTCKI